MKYEKVNIIYTYVERSAKSRGTETEDEDEVHPFSVSESSIGINFWGYHSLEDISECLCFS